jgi:SAM-dependent methyltransferase
VPRVHSDKPGGSPTRRRQQRRPLVINAGCGSPGCARLPDLFDDWRQLRVDIDPSVAPDIVASVTDLSAIPSGYADAVWSAHCLEHLFAHQVPAAFAEFRRVLREAGFACVIVPDVQAVAQWVANDRLHETLYQSSAGPITAHDILWGFGPALEAGYAAMAHRCGFTPTVLLQRLNGCGFAETVLRRRPTLELACLALCRSSANSAARDGLISRLML